jgi:uncharacterized protein YtpQ (UPF0354 family)
MRAAMTLRLISWLSAKLGFSAPSSSDSEWHFVYIKIRPHLSGLLLLKLAVGGALLAGCAEPPTPASGASQAAVHPASPAAGPKVNPSSAEAFTNSMLELIAGRNRDGRWSIKEPLVLTNAKELIVNLERIWLQCRTAASTCEDDAAHFADEVVKIATRPAEPPATSRQLMAIVRPVSYLQQIPNDVRRDILSEPLTASLLVVYVVDQGGDVRSVKAADLSGTGVSQDALPATARLNVAAALSVPPVQLACETNSVTVLASGNYYESSRLLVDQFWRDLADRTRASVVVAVPAADALVVACNPDHTQLLKLSQFIDAVSAKGQPPLSRALLKWTPGGWQEVHL